MMYVNVKPDKVRQAMAAFGPMPAAACARAILRGVARNQAIVPVGWWARLGWWFYRAAPGLFDWLACRVAGPVRAAIRAA
jgi:hypothetical protein